MNLINKIKSCSGIFTLAPASKDDITLAEKKLNVIFSREYKNYLAEFGVAIFNGHEFTGICNGKRLDVVRITEAQKRIHEFIPDDFYVVECLDIDDVVIWQDKNGVVYASTPVSKPKQIANSLYEYISN